MLQQYEIPELIHAVIASGATLHQHMNDETKQFIVRIEVGGETQRFESHMHALALGEAINWLRTKYLDSATYHEHQQQHYKEFADKLKSREITDAEHKLWREYRDQVDCAINSIGDSVLTYNEADKAMTADYYLHLSDEIRELKTAQEFHASCVLESQWRQKKKEEVAK